MRIAVVGATGQLGSDLVAALAGHQTLALGHDHVEVLDPASIERALVPFSPDWLVSTAAFHDVDRCDDEPARALEVNALGTAHLARAAARLGAGFLYVSTDYVFSGRSDRPWVESDAAEPVNAYGASKLAGEALARALCPRTLVVRTSGLFGPRPCRGKPGGRNFVDLMLRLGRERGKVRVVDDETLAPTYTPHLARALGQAMTAGASGTLHLAAAGHCSFFAFARAIFEEAGMDAVVVERAASGEFPKKAARPSFSALASERLAALGLAPLPHWREGLREHVQQRRAEASAAPPPPA